LTALILNEAAVHYMGLKNPVGETVTWWDKPYKVIAIVNNMIMEFPYNEAKPAIFCLSNDDVNIAIISIKPSVSTKDALIKIEPIVKKFNPEQPFMRGFRR
jgi:putative ABC transport system permease protein